MQPLPSRTTPSSAVSGFGRRSAGKAVIDPWIIGEVEVIFSVLH